MEGKNTSKPRRREWGLAAQVTVILALSISGVSGALGYLDFRSDLIRMESDVETDARARATVAAVSLAPLVAGYDYTTTEAVADAYARQNSVVFVRVINARGKTMAETSRKPTAVPPLPFSTPIVYSGNVVGRLEIEMSMDALPARRNIVIRDAVKSAVATFVLLWVSLFSLLSWRVLAPLRALRVKIEALSADRDPDPRDDGIFSNGSHSAEISSLMLSFDTMKENLAARTHDLRAALEKVEEGSRAKSDFLANMSHELRTPMNAILGFSDMMAKETLGPMGNPRYRDYAVDIYESGRHLLAFINDLLDLARIEARALELRDNVVDIRALIRMAIYMNDGLAKEANVSVNLAEPKNLPRFRGDELRLTQVFSNVIGNALKFTQENGRVDIRCGTDSTGCIEVSVSDTGIGIAPEDIERIQTPFARRRSPFVRTKEGLGIGLPLSKVFMEAHGGSLGIESRLGEGTRITLRFPVSRVVQA